VRIEHVKHRDVVALRAQRRERGQRLVVGVEQIGREHDQRASPAR
jgi:hypothetical protein